MPVRTIWGAGWRRSGCRTGRLVAKERGEEVEAVALIPSNMTEFAVPLKRSVSE